MSTVLTLEIPDELARRARALAAATNRRFEDAVVEWIGRAVEEPAIESLPDSAVLELCDRSFAPAQQEQLSDLLAELREGTLSDPGRGKLDDLMMAYRVGLVRKANAVREAVARGLQPRLGEDAA